AGSSGSAHADRETADPMRASRGPHLPNYCEALPARGVDWKDPLAARDRTAAGPRTTSLHNITLPWLSSAHLLMLLINFLRSTTHRLRPALMSSVSQSPNGFAVLLSIGLLTSMMVTSPLCSSPMSMLLP